MKRLPVGSSVIWSERMLDDTISDRRAVIRRHGRDASGAYIEIVLDDDRGTLARGLHIKVQRSQLRPDEPG